MKETIEFLKKEKGYMEYKSEINHFQFHLQKRIESKFVCETNNDLYINIKMHVYSHDDINYEGFKISITAKKNSKWWDLECHSLNIEELTDQINELELKLVELFNIL